MSTQTIEKPLTPKAPKNANYNGEYIAGMVQHLRFTGFTERDFSLLIRGNTMRILRGLYVGNYKHDDHPPTLD